MWLTTDLEREGTVRKGPGCETVVSQRPAGSRIAAVLLWSVSAASAVAATTLWLSADVRAGEGHPLSQPGFYSWLQTDIQHDHAGLSTFVVAGKNRFLFNCSLAEDQPVAKIASGVGAVFLTHLDDATTSGIEWLLDSPRARVDPESPLRVWGPRGTREWMRRRLGDSLTGRASRRPFTVTELEEGPVAESDGLLSTRYRGKRRSPCLSGDGPGRALAADRHRSDAVAPPRWLEPRCGRCDCPAHKRARCRGVLRPDPAAPRRAGAGRNSCDRRRNTRTLSRYPADRASTTTANRCPCSARPRGRRRAPVKRAATPHVLPGRVRPSLPVSGGLLMASRMCQG